MRVQIMHSAAIVVGTAFGMFMGCSLAADKAATHACAKIPDATQRLACYDTAFPLSPDIQMQAAAKARSEFGLDHGAEKAAVRSPASAVPKDIQAVLTKLDYNGSSRVFTLDNEQVWIQTDLRGGRVRIGQTVRIRKALLGSYMLVMPNGVAVRVKRQR